MTTPKLRSFLPTAISTSDIFHPTSFVPKVKISAKSVLPGVIFTRDQVSDIFLYKLVIFDQTQNKIEHVTVPKVRLSISFSVEQRNKLRYDG